MRARCRIRPLVVAALIAGCSQNGSDGVGGAKATTGAGVECPLCITEHDCAQGAVCAQLGNDSYCVPVCDQAGACDPSRACVTVVTVAGDQASACAPTDTSLCAAEPAGTGGGSATMCGTLVAPSVPAACTSCASGQACQSNGCYGGWWCDTATSKCRAQPANCGGGTPPTTGPAPTGTVNGDGGTLSHLLFTVVGDTRPPVIDDTAGYPKTIISTIYADVEALNPRPPFSLSTGDYVFAKPYGPLAAGQFDLYLAARQQYKGVVFPAMGNHECTGGTASNCGPGTVDGLTSNYSSFLSKLLAPIGKTLPYYSVNINAVDGSWTSKFVFIAANAWSSAQATWLDSTLAQSTTYTFIVRHESKLVTQAPGVSPSEQIISQFPFTLIIVGHTHTYAHYPGREVVIGNGGAPLTGNKNYGYGLFYQRPNGTIQVDMVDYLSGATDPSFRFAVNPDGSNAPL